MGEIKIKKIRPRTTGLTNIPSINPTSYQRMLKGRSRSGDQMLMTKKKIPIKKNNVERGKFPNRAVNTEAKTKTPVKKKPNFLLVGKGMASERLNFWNFNCMNMFTSFKFCGSEKPTALFPHITLSTLNIIFVLPIRNRLP